MHAYAESFCENLDIERIRMDGGTQGRGCIAEGVVGQYAELMKAGAAFPPVRVWFDGSSYWLSDGFHRIASARLIGLHEFRAQIFHGSLNEAMWDSFGANSSHGMRLSRADAKSVALRALRHKHAQGMSNNEIARHLGIPETTLRRWRERSSSSPGEDKTCLATRNGKAYVINTRGIGAKTKCQKHTPKPQNQLRDELEIMKAESSSKARRILNIIGIWAFGSCTPEACLDGIENVVQVGR